MRLMTWRALSVSPYRLQRVQRPRPTLRHPFLPLTRLAPKSGDVTEDHLEVL